jgi:hypothetical protein
MNGMEKSTRTDLGHVELQCFECVQQMIISYNQKRTMPKALDAVLRNQVVLFLGSEEGYRWDLVRVSGIYKKK